MRTCFTNGRLFTGDTIVEGYDLFVEDGVVTSFSLGELLPEGVEVVDLGGHLLAPGFIDVQVNGGGGVLFNDQPDADGLASIVAAHRQFGSTSLLPTLISDELSVIESAVKAVQEGMAQGLPGLRGVHFEGPYLNPERRGIHQESHLRAVDDEALSLLTSEGLGVVVTTVAPERVDQDFIRSLSRAGVRVCGGHSAATFEETREGIGAGITCFTHLFNAMSPLASREPGMVGAALEDPESYVGVIADGHHIHYASLRVAVSAKAEGKVILVTDAMPSVGAKSKDFILQGQRISAEGGCCQSEQGTLAGSDLDMATAVRNTVDHIGLPLEEALRMASLYPAAFLGLDDRLGRIAPGYEADFVLLDEDINVLTTWVGGNAE